MSLKIIYYTNKVFYLILKGNNLNFNDLITKNLPVVKKLGHLRIN